MRRLAPIIILAAVAACSDQSTPTAPVAGTPSPLFAAQGGGGNSCAPKCNTAPILFDRGINGGVQHVVIKMNQDGSNPTFMHVGSGPAWGPGYKKIAFSAANVLVGPEIWTMNADGTGAKAITNDGSNMFPSWSPDGTKIAFVSTRTGRYEIFTMNADGTNEKQITFAGGIYPSWSPDGKKILFDSNRNGNDDVFVMNTDGSGVQQLTTDPGLDAGAVWAPDGKHIAYENMGPGCDIVIMKADGSAKTKIVADLADCQGPSWSPSGNQLAFASDVSGVGTVVIFTMNLDGTGLTQLTTGQYLDAGAAWSRK